ncbi:MAG TPA: cytochrome c [Pyrinomonadaceae bacterium]|jgi:mono/diheme cytochrome c family protein|nr:cytochrome c [Pyrinomonadaceae bacterium]
MNCYLKTVVKCGVVCLALSLLLLASASVKGELQPKSSRVRKADELFNSNCARCHGADGRGDTPPGHMFKAPDFTDPEWWKQNSSITDTKTLRSVVTRGKDAMPGFGKKLTRSEINLLVDRIRGFRKLERKS